MNHVSLSVFLCCLLIACSTGDVAEEVRQPTPEGQSVGDCTDRADNDGDGDFDCDDSGCEGSPDCVDSSDASDASDSSDASDASDASDVGEPHAGFVFIEAGTFIMGSPENELGRDDDETQHQVTLTSGFYMSDHEVTQAEWRALIGNNPSFFNNGTCPTCPVEYVNWYEAVYFANVLSESEGLTACYVLEGCNGSPGVDLGCTGVTLQDGSGNTVTSPYECEGYRLPTEAEWEYAARAGTTTAFYNGDITFEWGSDPNADDIAWYTRNSGSTTHAVKGKLPNAWGLYDMIGNVWEWVWDRYGSYSGNVTDPTGPSSGSYRVLRGGCWGGYAANVRVAHRGYEWPVDPYESIGFRLARTVQ